MMKKLLCILLTAIIISGALLATAAAGETEVISLYEQSFASPEDAINHFIAGIAEGDLEKALAATAIDAYGSSFDFAYQAERLQVIMPAINEAPAEYELYGDLNRLKQAAYLAQQIKLFCYSFFIGDMDFSVPEMLEDQAQIDEFITAVDPAKLANLKVVGIDMPTPDVMNSEAALENAEKHGKTIGADTVTERIVLYNLDGDLFMGGFQLADFGGVWKIKGLNSIYANQSAYGDVSPVTMDEYFSLTE